MIKKRVTVICVYNDSEKYQNALMQSLLQQNEAFELIAIDNVNNKYKSCSAALNSAVPQIATEYVVFSHQDILLTDESMLQRFVEYMRNAKEGDIFGVAGVLHSRSGVITNILHGSARDPAGSYRLPEKIMECDAIDECFFGGLTQTFRQEPFDEKICNDWHLYATELCLREKRKGSKVFVCDIPLVHLSKGKLTHGFYSTFLKLCRAYHPYYPVIHTTVIVSKTRFVSRNRLYFRHITEMVRNRLSKER